LFIETDTNDLGAMINQHQKLVGSAASLKLPVVCPNCNKKWMGNIELNASAILRPALAGQGITISPAQQRIVARWAALKAMLYDLRRPNDHPVVLDADLKAFYAVRNPPPQFQLRLGQYKGQLKHSGFHLRATTFATQTFGELPAGEPHAELLTVIFGELIVHSVLVGLRGRDVPGLYQRGELDLAMVRVWPPSVGDITWPPTEAMDDQAVTALTGTPYGPVTSIGSPLPGVPRRGSTTS